MPAGLFLHQLRQQSGALRFTVKRISNQLSQVFAGEGSKDDLLDTRSSFADRFEPAHQRVGGTNLVVSVGADQHQVLHIRPGQQILEQIEGCHVKPLQIIEEQCERMFRPCENANKSPEHHLEATLRVLGRKIRDWWLRPDDELQFGYQIRDEQSVWA